MTMTPENKCAMCGKDAIISDGFDKQNEKDQQQEHNPASRTMIVEQIDGSYYTFDTKLYIDVQKVQCCIWKQFCR
jgi:hypothetical protein